jgi:hypothetical protein
VMGGGRVRSVSWWLGPARHLDPHGRGLVPSRRPVRETGTAPIICWCLSRLRGTAWWTEALGPQAAPVALVGADAPSVTAVKRRARSPTRSPGLDTPAMAHSTPSGATGALFPLDKPSLFAG